MESHICLILLCYTASVICVYETNKRMNWADALQHCKLATKSEADNHQSYNRSWVGALQLSTPWMVHEVVLWSMKGPFLIGCYLLTKSFKNKTNRTDNSPAYCSFHCRHYKYFALKNIQCLCNNDINDMSLSDPEVCNANCKSSEREKCGSTDMLYGNIYRHVTGNDIPNGNIDQEDNCSVFKVRNNTVGLTSAKCEEKHTLLCSDHMTDLINFQTAQQFKCGLSSKLEIKKEHENDLNDGHYWSGIHRHQIIRWLETDSLQDVCEFIEKFDTVRCIAVDFDGKNTISKTASCKDLLPVLCSRTSYNLSNQDLIRNCTKDENVRQTSVIIDENVDKTSPTIDVSMLENATSHTFPENSVLIDEKKYILLTTIVGVSLLVLIMVVAVSILLFIYQKKKRQRQLHTIKSKDRCSEEETYTISPEYVDPGTLADSVYADPDTILKENTTTYENAIYLKELYGDNLETIHNTKKANAACYDKEAAYYQSDIDHLKFLYDTPKPIRH